MEIKEFTESIREELEKRTGLEVKLQEVRKNNNVILHGISIKEPSSNIAPTIYLDSYYAVYENGVELEEIAEGIYKVYQREKTDTPFEINWFRDWEKVRGLVAYKLINYESNKDFLEAIPHEKFLDLAKVYYVSVESERFGNGTILIHNNHLELWGITAEQLGVVAEENTPKLLPVEIGTMCDIINSFMGDDNIISEMEEDFKKYPMYVATNHSKIFGAAIMCYPNAIKEFAERMESDLFILPSSTHEIIVVLPKEDDSVDALKEMVYEVNRTQLAAEEFLSDSVYYYSREEGTIRICGLTLKDIDLKKKTINIDHQLQYVGNKGKYIEKTKTTAGTRVLPMSDEVYDAFKRVIANRAKPRVEEMIDGYTGFIFLDKRGKPMMPYQWEKKFQHSVAKYNRIYRVQLPKITPHVCRHTYCTNMAKRQVSVETLKYLMGHTDISVTSSVYTHLKLEDAQEEMKRLEKAEAELKKCAE